jgi:hypothetical protein
MNVELKEYDISHELWREYEFYAGVKNSNGEVMRIYRINKPKKLYIRPNGITHRVVDEDGIAHCVPTVGFMGCVLRWQNPAGEKPVNF